MVFDGEVAIFRVGTGGSGLILQRYYHADWAGNFMMQLVVDNLDERWSEIDSLDLPKQFGVPAPKPPTIQPWGLRVAYVVDPAGVLWHVTERPASSIGVHPGKRGPNVVGRPSFYEVRYSTGRLADLAPYQRAQSGAKNGSGGPAVLAVVAASATQRTTD